MIIVYGLWKLNFSLLSNDRFNFGTSISAEVIDFLNKIQKKLSWENSKLNITHKRLCKSWKHGKEQVFISFP